MILDGGHPYFQVLDVGISFKELVVWQRAFDLSLEVYRLTATFPSSEQFGLTSQLRRVSVSIASNIAEGNGRVSKGEYLQFLGHARGSLCELQTQPMIAQTLGFGASATCESATKLSADIGRLLQALMKSLKN